MNLPGFKGSCKNLDALTAGPDHIDFYGLHNRLCRPRPVQFKDLETLSDYSSSASGCLSLTTWWMLRIFKDQSHFSSRSALQAFLRDLDIKLCPHKNFDDPWIVEVLYRKAHPKEKLADPVDQWEADAKFGWDTDNCKVQCHHCSTTYKDIGSTNLLLSVTRDLGKGTSPLDPVWLAQCGVTVEEERAT